MVPGMIRRREPLLRTGLAKFLNADCLTISGPISFHGKFLIFYRTSKSLWTISGRIIMVLEHALLQMMAIQLQM